MSPVLPFPLTDEIIASFSAALADDFCAYRNHVSACLAKEGLGELEAEVLTLINEHHKVFPYVGRHSPNTEAFRKADLVDLSLGMIRFGLPFRLVRSVFTAFPNAGFHRRLGILTARQLMRAPLRPLPMFHW